MLSSIHFAVWNQGVYHTDHGDQKAKERVWSNIRKNLTHKHAKGENDQIISEQYKFGHMKQSWSHISSSLTCRKNGDVLGLLCFIYQGVFNPSMLQWNLTLEQNVLPSVWKLDLITDSYGSSYRIMTQNTPLKTPKNCKEPNIGLWPSMSPDIIFIRCLWMELNWNI